MAVFIVQNKWDGTDREYYYHERDAIAHVALDKSMEYYELDVNDTFEAHRTVLWLIKDFKMIDDSKEVKIHAPDMKYSIHPRLELNNSGEGWVRLQLDNEENIQMNDFHEVLDLLARMKSFFSKHPDIVMIECDLKLPSPWVDVIVAKTEVVLHHEKIKLEEIE